MSSTRLASWGRYPPFPQHFVDCSWRSELHARLVAVAARDGTTLPYGAGRSYGDSCLAASNELLCARPMDRFISADWNTGVLVAEAGVTLEEVLRYSIPRGWFLPVTPGTRYATLGGAVANDVHGKNHHRRGTFGRHVRRFGLVRSDAGHVECSPEEWPEMYAATIGGLGLTGVIEWIELQLVPIRSARLDQVTQRFGSLQEFFELSRELDATHEFCVAWIDCTARGASRGRGVYSAADFSTEGALELARGRKLRVPVTPPLPLFNQFTLPLLNEAYWRRAPGRRRTSQSGYDAFFYPLDGLLEWNRLYGPAGFQQYQAVVPDHVAQDAIRALLDAIAGSRTGSFLAVLKRCGDVPSPGLMSFPMPGVSLALDFPHTARLDAMLFPRMDAILREAGGRLYPAKDAHMSAEDFRRSYPAWPEVEALRDPALISHFWRRVTQ